MNDLEETEWAYHERRLLTLADEAIKQAILTRNVDMACKYELKKIAIKALHPTLQFDALRQVQNTWYRRGRDRSSIFDLEVSIALADTCIRWATDDHRRSLAFSDKNNAQQALD